MDDVYHIGDSGRVYNDGRYVVMSRLIILLFCRKLGVKLYQPFKFSNQHNKDNIYYFTPTCLMKEQRNGQCKKSNIQFNYLLNPYYGIEKI